MPEVRKAPFSKEWVPFQRLYWSSQGITSSMQGHRDRSLSRIVSLISEHFARFVFKNKLMAFNESIHEH